MDNLSLTSSNIASRCPLRVRQKPHANGHELLNIRAHSNGDYHIDIMSCGTRVQQFSFWQWEQNLTDEDMHHEVMVGLAEWCRENKVTFTKGGLSDFSFIKNKIAQAKNKH
jgi:hypothetical protein